MQEILWSSALLLPLLYISRRKKVPFSLVFVFSIKLQCWATAYPPWAPLAAEEVLHNDPPQTGNGTPFSLSLAAGGRFLLNWGVAMALAHTLGKDLEASRQLPPWQLPPRQLPPGHVPIWTSSWGDNWHIIPKCWQFISISVWQNVRNVSKVWLSVGFWFGLLQRGQSTFWNRRGPFLNGVWLFLASFSKIQGKISHFAKLA